MCVDPLAGDRVEVRNRVLRMVEVRGVKVLRRVDVRGVVTELSVLTDTDRGMTVEVEMNDVAGVVVSVKMTVAGVWRDERQPSPLSAASGGVKRHSHTCTGSGHLPLPWTLVHQATWVTRMPSQC